MLTFGASFTAYTTLHSPVRGLTQQRKMCLHDVSLDLAISRSLFHVSPSRRLSHAQDVYIYTVLLCLNAPPCNLDTNFQVLSSTLATSLCKNYSLLAIISTAMDYMFDDDVDQAAMDLLQTANPDYPLYEQPPPPSPPRTQHPNQTPPLQPIQGGQRIDNIPPVEEPFIVDEHEGQVARLPRYVNPSDLVLKHPALEQAEPVPASANSLNNDNDNDIIDPDDQGAPDGRHAPVQAQPPDNDHPPENEADRQPTDDEDGNTQPINPRPPTNNQQQARRAPRSNIDPAPTGKWVRCFHPRCLWSHHETSEYSRHSRKHHATDQGRDFYWANLIVVSEADGIANKARFDKKEQEDTPADAMTLARYYTIVRNGGDPDNTDPANYPVLAYDFRSTSVFSASGMPMADPARPAPTMKERQALCGGRIRAGRGN
jgi:hypothetical protein